MIIPFYATIALATDPVTDAVTAMTGLANAYSFAPPAIQSMMSWRWASV